MEKFAPGAIIKVKVKNFVTYALTEFTLSPSLNMIIGPNGTGKSTFVCAVCLGLGGSPLLLGRQKALNQFIKNGENSATIEITLKNEPGKPEIVIQRDFYPTNKSDWYLSGKPVSEQKIKGRLRDMNIQLDNLCQFLPQEKVADFAKLSPEDLLQETERAIEVGLLEQHQQLIKLDEEKFELDDTLKTKIADHEKLSEERKRFEDEARKYEAFQKKKEEFEDHERLLPYAKIQDLKVKQQEVKEKRDQLKKRLEEFQELTRPYEEAAASFDGDIQASMNQVHDKKTEQQRVKEEVKTYKGKLSDIEQKHQKLLSLINSNKTKAEMKKKDHEKGLAQLEKLKEDRELIQLLDEDTLNSYKSKSSELFVYDDELDTKYNNIYSEYQRFKKDEAFHNDVIQKTRHQFKSDDRIHVLDSGGHGYIVSNRLASEAKKAVGLLRSPDFHQYKGKVFEPPCVTLSATKPEYAAYLEELVDIQTTFALTAVSKDAYNDVSKEIFQKHKNSVPFRYLANRQLNPSLSREQLNELGFDGYLRDFVTGPKAVVQMLAETAFIHDVPVATRELSEQQIQRLQRPQQNGQLLFRKFISGDSMYNLSRSRYGSNQVTARISQVNMRPNYFSAGGMTDERKRQLNEKIKQSEANIEALVARRAQIKEDLYQVDEERRPVKEERAEVEKRIKDAALAKKEYDRLEVRINSLEDKVKKLEQEANKDYSAELAIQQKKLRLVAEERIKILGNISKVQIKSTKISQAIAVLEVKKFDQENKKVSIKKLIESIAQEKKELEKQYQEAKKRYQEYKQSSERKRLLEQTMRYTGDEKERLNNLIVKYTELERFTEVRIRDMLEGLESELTLLGTGSKSSVNTLERINEQLETLDQEIPELELRIKQQSFSLKDIHNEWEPKLLDMVHKISTKFSSIFPSVGVAGEVKVARAEKYSDWRLEIKVKFRDEGELKVLDSHSQSGGERAVSTVFYMISMQELTTSPFRVVDEINQGMDARNERVVHKHMVQVACQEHTSQYFLITPKLLTNLFYSQNMRVHCIMAGPWTPNPTEKAEYLSLGATSIYT